MLLDFDVYGLLSWTLTTILVHILVLIYVKCFPSDFVFESTNAWTYPVSYFVVALLVTAQKDVTWSRAIVIGVLLVLWSCANTFNLWKSRVVRQQTALALDPRYIQIHKPVKVKGKHPGYDSSKLMILVSYQWLGVWANGMSIPYLLSNDVFFASTLPTWLEVLIHVLSFGIMVPSLLMMCLIGLRRTSPGNRTGWLKHPLYAFEIAFAWGLEIITLACFSLSPMLNYGHAAFSLLGAGHTTLAISFFSGFVPPNKYCNYPKLMDAQAKVLAARHADSEPDEEMKVLMELFEEPPNFELEQYKGKYEWTQKSSVARVRQGWGWGMWRILMFGRTWPKELSSEEITSPL